MSDQELNLDIVRDRDEFYDTLILNGLTIIGRISNTGMARDEARALGHQMVAAPEMLAMLKQLEWLWIGDRTVKSCPVCGRPVLRKDADLKLHADYCELEILIRKAEGHEG